MGGVYGGVVEERWDGRAAKLQGVVLARVRMVVCRKDPEVVSCMSSTRLEKVSYGVSSTVFQAMPISCLSECWC